MRFRLALVPALLILAAAPAAAERGPLDRVLERHAEGGALRAHLLAFADSVAGGDAWLASQAVAWAAQSFAREGEADSAVALHERALTLDGREPRRIELANALLARLGPEDAARARAVLRPIQPVTPELPDPSHATPQALLAWSLYLGGDADSAARLLTPLEARLSEHREWRYRLACVAFERGEWVRVQQLLTPLGLASRLYDLDVMDMLEKSAEELGARRRLQPMLLQELHKRDQVEQTALAEIGARRVAFRAADGFPLGGSVLAPPRPARARAAVVVMAPGDTVALYDSLAVGLRRMGLAVILLDPRGSGRSVAPGCPLPEAWRGRERRMEAAVAADVRAAAGALARATGCDSTRYLVAGVGASGTIAILAARREPRVRAVLVVSPTAAAADRGALRSAVADLAVPVYFQTGPEDFTTWDLIETLYEATDPRASRIADSDKPGTMATLFRRDPRIFARFSQWLAETWPPPARPRATRPSPPRSR